MFHSAVVCIPVLQQSLRVWVKLSTAIELSLSGLVPYAALHEQPCCDYNRKVSFLQQHHLLSALTARGQGLAAQMAPQTQAQAAGQIRAIGEHQTRKHSYARRITPGFCKRRFLAWEAGMIWKIDRCGTAIMPRVQLAFC